MLDADLSFQITVEPEVKEPISKAPLAEEGTMPLTYAFLESVTQQLLDIFLKGEEAKFQQLVDQLFQGFADQTPQIRIKMIHVCGSLLKDMGFVSQPRFVELLTDPLILVLMEEEDPDLLKEISVLLSQATANLIRFSDYQRASRIHTHLRRRTQLLQDSKNGQTRLQEVKFIQELDTKTQEILLEDLKSQDPSRLQQATQLLDSLGQTALPVLIEVIKKEYDLRLRQIAVHLLGNLDPEAAKLLKRELVLAGYAEERVRILEVMDNVTQI